MVEWATHYGEIPDALEDNDAVQSHAIELISEEPIIAKSLEGGSREDDFREILIEYFRGTLDHDTAEQRTHKIFLHTNLPIVGTTGYSTNNGLTGYSDPKQAGFTTNPSWRF